MAANGRLDSWKEIANYLRRDVRTVMRWETDKGLPVHRVPGGHRHAVFAYRPELDAWLLGKKPSELSAEARAAGPRPHRLARISRLAQAWLLTALAIGVFVGASILWKAETSSSLAGITLRENRFEALNKAGRVLWSYLLTGDHRAIAPGLSPGIAYVGDLVGDGHKEALVSLPDEHGDDRAVYCFSETGKLMWRYEFKETLTFGSGDYGPPWLIGAWLLHRASGHTRIALALQHNVWWPSLLVLLDDHGQEASRFVNSGVIYSMAWLDTSSSPLLLAGGVRNREDEVSGALAVLDGNQPSGTSPEQPGSGFECKSCPPGRPLKYFVFPRSELNTVSDSPHNRVFYVHRGGDVVYVKTAEYLTERLDAVGMFEFSPDLELKRASWSDAYREAHWQFEREGKITHSWERCPDRFGPRLIRSWDPQHGWRELRPNAIQPGKQSLQKGGFGHALNQRPGQRHTLLFATRQL